MLPVLDIFILSQLDRGCETPYDLLRQAGLSLGASTPALRRLTETGLITRVDGQGTTKRPRHQYKLTASGKRSAREGWKQHIVGSKTSGDLDSILRLVDMAKHYGGANRELATFLEKVTSQRQRAAEQAELAVSQRNGMNDYVTLRLRCDAGRFAAEATALAQVSAELKKKTAKPDHELKSRSRQKRPAKQSQKATKAF